MGRRKKLDGSSSPQFSPASDPEERENQMISLAVNLAEQQLRGDGFISGHRALSQARFDSKQA